MDNEQADREFLDPDHPRASITDGERMVIDPGKALENIARAMERVDLDIATPVSIGEDVIALTELMSLIQYLRMGPHLVVHVVNTGMRIMTARYPADLVGRPLPPEYALGTLNPAIQINARQHEIAKAIFNRRTARAVDLTAADVPEVEALDVAGQIEVFTALFFMYGTKVGAMKYTTGIE